jgi:hypothetical protein
MATWLLMVDELTGYTVLLDLLSKTQVHLMEGLRKGMAYFQKYGHVVERVVTDAESCFGACATDLGNMGVNLQQRPPGEHEKFAESKTRSLRAQMRTIEAGLGFPLPDILSPYLAIAATFMGNLVPNVRTPLSSPHILVTGERVDLALYAKFAFGQPVLIPTKDAPTATNRGEAKATEAMFLGHLFGSLGSGYFLCFPAFSKADIQVRAVQAAREMPMTQTVVDSLSNLRPIGVVVAMEVADDLNRVTTSADYAAMVQESRAVQRAQAQLKGRPSKGGGGVAFEKQLVQPDPVIMHVPPPRPKDMDLVDEVLGAPVPAPAVAATAPVVDAPVLVPNPVPNVAAPPAAARPAARVAPAYGRSLRSTGPVPSTVSIVDVSSYFFCFRYARSRRAFTSSSLTRLSMGISSRHARWKYKQYIPHSDSLNW